MSAADGYKVGLDGLIQWIVCYEESLPEEAMRVLIVEDEWEVASLIKAGLEEYDFVPDIAGNAMEARKQLADQEADRLWQYG